MAQEEQGPSPKMEETLLFKGSFQLETNSEFGRHLVASENIPAGTLILKERPVIIEPLDPNELGADNGNLDPMVLLSRPPTLACLSCGREFTSILPCSTCKWPICSPECSQAWHHKEFECKLFSERKIPFPDIVPPMILYPAIGILRGMLLKRNQKEIWKKVEDLQHCEESSLRIEKPPFENFRQMLQFGMFRQCFQFCDLDLDDDDTFVNSVDWERFQGIMDINGFSLQYKFDEDQTMTRVRNVYLESSMMAHSCFPNCTWSFSPGPEFTMEIWTGVDIAKGQPLTITYSKGSSLVGAIERQRIGIRSSTGFFCLCSRCVDPTELGTMYSGIKCQCSEGYHLASDPLILTSDWICTACKAIKPADEVLQLIADAQILVNRVYHSNIKPGLVEALLEEFLKNFHPNHWVILTLGRAVLANIDDKGTGEEPDPDEEYLLDLYIAQGRTVARIYDLILPGLHWQKGEVKMRLYKALLTKYKKIAVEDGSGEAPDRKLKLEELHELQKEIWELRRRDPTCQKKGQGYVKELEELRKETEVVRGALEEGVSGLAGFQDLKIE